ncbi:hypothetical protein MHYP_G00215000 [Metynnis hypsauchen]
MTPKIVCGLWLVASLLAHIDDVSGRAIGEVPLHLPKQNLPANKTRVDQSTTPPPHLLMKPANFASTQVQSPPVNFTKIGSLKRERRGLKEFVSKMVQHFHLHAPRAILYAFPITFIAMTVLCCLTCAIDRPVESYRHF